MVVGCMHVAVSQRECPCGLHLLIACNVPKLNIRVVSNYHKCCFKDALKLTSYHGFVFCGGIRAWGGDAGAFLTSSFSMTRTKEQF